MLALALVAVLAGIAYRGSAKAGVAVLAFTIFLIPDTLALPGRSFDHLPAFRVILLAVVAGLITKVLQGRASPEIFRPTRVHMALLVWLAVVLITGFALTPAGLTLSARASGALLIFDQVVILFGVVAATRLIGDPWWVARVFLFAFAGSVVIAVSEEVFEWSYGRWVLSRPGLRPTRLGAQELESRAGELRVRAASQFALGYAWVSAVMVPVAVAFVLRARKRWMGLLPVAAGLTVFWSQTRSAIPALGIGLVFFSIFTRLRREVVVLLVVGALGATAVYFSSDTLREPFTSESASESDRSRSDRQAIALEEAAERPITGHGLGATSGRFQLSGLDHGYLKAYLETGVVGLVLLAFALVTAVLTVGRGLRAPPTDQRLLVAGCTAGALLGMVAVGIYDALDVPGTYMTIWSVIGVGIVASEPTVPRVRTRPLVPAAVAGALLVLAAAGLGLVIDRLAPTEAAWTARFETLPVGVAAHARADFEFNGRPLAETICSLSGQLRVHGADVDCRSDLETGGLGRMEWRGPSAEGVRSAAVETAIIIAGHFPGFQLHFETPQPVVGSPTWVSTAPAWLPLATVLMVAFVVSRPRAGTTRSAREGATIR